MSENPSDLPTVELMNSLLPKFDFFEIIESEKQSATYLANQISLDRPVTVKLFPPSSVNHTGVPSAFDKAAAAVAALKHPNLVSIFDSGNLEDRPYLVMEAVAGKTLLETTGGNALDSAKAFALITGICEGLETSHHKGVVHGSVNPSNILISNEGIPKLGNFSLDRSTTDRTSPYAAPELSSRTSYATKRSDVFSLAAIYQELLTGSPTGLIAPPVETLPKQRQELAAVLKRAMDQEPGKRMPDAAAFYSEVKKHQGSTGRLLVTAPPRQTAPPQKPKRATQPLAAKKADHGLALKLGLIALLIVGIFIAWGSLNRAKTARNEENKQLIAKEQAKKDAALAAAMKRTNGPTQYTKNQKLSERAVASAEKSESQEDSLERLRARLKSGKRSEMPPGTLSRGGSKYLLIERAKNMERGE